jgi:hypothetical protein
MPRFKIGDRVELNGVLAELYGGTAGTVLSVVPDKDRITRLDEYTVEIEGVGQLKLCDFQLTHAGLIGNEHG